MAKRQLKIKTTHFTHLTDTQWTKIRIFVETGRKIRIDLRIIVNGILKILRTGCQWRNLDKAFGIWQTVYYYFRKWQKNGVIGKILDFYVQTYRITQGKEATATCCAVDSQSVKMPAFINLDTGIDGNKKINGRKRHIAVDTLGLPLAIYVSGASVNDGKAGVELLPILDRTSPNLKLIRADAAYKGTFTEAANYCGYTVEVAQKPPTEKGFVPEKGRWQVERSFAWLNFYRRLAKDYEKTVDSSVAFLQLAFISIILARLQN